MKPAVKILVSVIALVIAKGSANPLVPLTLIDEQQSDTIDLSSFGVMLFGEPDESVGKAVRDWTPDHDQNPEELGTYVQGDMLIPGVEGRNGLVTASSRWPNGVVPYSFAPSLCKKLQQSFNLRSKKIFSFKAQSDRAVIQRAIGEYHSKTCIKFVPRSNERDFINFENSDTGCWSSVGKVGRKQSVNLQSPGCTSKVGTAIHEIMHALGFLHEQNRIDRDSYVRILTSNIKPGLALEL